MQCSSYRFTVCNKETQPVIRGMFTQPLERFLWKVCKEKLHFWATQERAKRVGIYQPGSPLSSADFHWYQSTHSKLIPPHFTSSSPSASNQGPRSQIPKQDFYVSVSKAWGARPVRHKGNADSGLRSGFQSLHGVHKDIGKAGDGIIQKVVCSSMKKRGMVKGIWEGTQSLYPTQKA